MSFAETPGPTAPASAPKSPEGGSGPTLGLSKLSTAIRFWGEASWASPLTQASSEPTASAAQQRNCDRRMRWNPRAEAARMVKEREKASNPGRAQEDGLQSGACCARY